MSYIVSSKNTFLHFRDDGERLGIRKSLSCSSAALELKERKSISTVDLEQLSRTSSWTRSDTLDDSDTTIMIRHIPCKYKQEALRQEVAAVSDKFDYFYLPPARTAMIEKNLGYAFVNFKTPQQAREFMSTFQGYQFRMFPNSQKRAVVMRAECQGKKANYQSYIKSKVFKTKFAPWMEI